MLALFHLIRFFADAGSTVSDPSVYLPNLGIAGVFVGSTIYLYKQGRDDRTTDQDQYRKDLASKDLALLAATDIYRKDMENKDREIRDMRDEMIRRERMLADTAMPALTRSAGTIRETVDVVRSAVDRRPTHQQEKDMVAVLQRLEQVLPGLEGLLTGGS